MADSGPGMAAAFVASILDALPGLAFGSTDADAGNRFSMEGVTVEAGQAGTWAVAIRKLEAASLRLAMGPFVAEAGRVVLHLLVARVRIEAGRLRLEALEAATAEVRDVKLRAPVAWPASAPPDPHAAGLSAPSDAGAWKLDPLASADGTIHAEIVDAHLLFDADVTVPIREGGIDFNYATVEHVGPDSRMGVSRLGLYVDAPNGRSYLYQFTSAPVAGVAFEHRGALLGPRVPDRGHLRLQAFGEWLVRHARGGRGQGQGFTDQARLLFDRTAVSGTLQLGDGHIAVPGVQAELTGRAEGRNTMGLRAQAVGRGLAVDLPSLAVRSATWQTPAAELRCEALTGAITLQLSVEGGALRLDMQLAEAKLSGLRWGRRQAKGGDS